MVVECVTNFRDLKAGTMRRAGERFSVSKERAEAINGTRYGMLVREVAEETSRARGRRTAKAEEQ